MKHQLVATAVIIFFPITGQTLTRCDQGYASLESPSSISILSNILEPWGRYAPNSPEDVTFDDTAANEGCPLYLRLNGNMGRFTINQYTTTDIYSVEFKNYNRPSPEKECDKIVDSSAPPKIITSNNYSSIGGWFIYCTNVSYTPPGSPPPPDPGSDPRNQRPAPPPSCRKSESSTPNPVFLATGEKHLEKVDWLDNGPHPLTLQRTYYSGDSLRTGIRQWKDWTHNFEQRLVVIGVDETGPDYVRILNGGAKQIFFTKSNGVWTNTNGKDTLTQTSGGWRHGDKETDSISDYNSFGQIKQKRARNGWTYKYTHGSNGRVSSVTNAFGRRITFAYDGHLSSVSQNGELLVSYDSDGETLSGAIYPNGYSELYSYEYSLLTEVRNNSGEVLGTFTYDNEKRVTSTVKPLVSSKYAISYLSDGSVKVNDPLGIDRLYKFLKKDGYVTLSSLSLPIKENPDPIKNRVLDSNGNIQTENDFLGTNASYTWNSSRRLPLTRTEAVGTTDSRKTTFAWHTKWRLPTKIAVTGREITFTYDSLGNPLTQTIRDTSVSPAQVQTWTWTYFPSGLVATETEPNGAVSSFSYDSKGNLIQAQNALDQFETYSHDSAGRVLTHTSASGMVSGFQYDSRGRLTRVQRGDQVTVYTYRSTGQVATVTAPFGYQVTYDYDAAQRLVGWRDNRGASATYTLDGMGNRVSESIMDAQGQTAWKVARTINSLNRVESIVAGGIGNTPASISYGYDANGDLVRSTETVDGAVRNTELGLDALRRVKSIKSAENASAALKYNALDAVTRATDFKGIATSYTRDALGNAPSEASPDSGTQTATYDALGLPKQVTDALGRATTITRDALGRPTELLYADGTRTTLRYDLPGTAYNAPGAPQASVGYLSEVQDPTATTTFQRDILGRITRKTQAVTGGSSGATETRSVAYAYHPAGTAGAGLLASITYPSGKQLAHVYDSTGQLTGLLWNGQPLVSGITWNPLGQPTGWQWPGFVPTPGSSTPLTEQRTYTDAGQLASTALLQLSWDGAGRVSAITQQHLLPTASTTVAQQVGLSSAYTYDRLGRLTASAHSAPPGTALPTGWSLSDVIGANSMGYAYDANGNRTQAFYNTTTPAGTATLQRTVQTTSGTNRISGYTQLSKPAGSSTGQTTTVAYTLDASGALTKKGDYHLHQSAQGRIAKSSVYADPAAAQAVSYTYNALAQRLLKRDARLSTATPLTEHAVYADDGIGSTVLGLYGNRRSTHSAAPAGEPDSTEVIYLPTAAGPLPIAAQINGRLYAIDSDHLNTPRRLTNTQGQVAWQWLITGFGEVPPTLGAKGYAINGIDNGKVYSEAVAFNLRYPGQQWDEETGLSYNLNRYYDQDSGRYIQSDPIGLDGGWNRFGYVEGNPLSFIDPQGLEKIILFNPNAALISQRGLYMMADAFPDQAGELLIFGHANNAFMADDRSGNWAWTNRKSLDAQALAKFINQSGKWKNRMPITLYGCESAQGENSLAEQLSKILNTRVIGFPDKITYDPRNRKAKPHRPIIFDPPQ